MRHKRLIGELLLWAATAILVALLFYWPKLLRLDYVVWMVVLALAANGLLASSGFLRPKIGRKGIGALLIVLLVPFCSQGVAGWNDRSDVSRYLVLGPEYSAGYFAAAAAAFPHLDLTFLQLDDAYAKASYVAYDAAIEAAEAEARRAEAGAAYDAARAAYDAARAAYDAARAAYDAARAADAESANAARAADAESANAARAADAEAANAAARVAYYAARADADDAGLDYYAAATAARRAEADARAAVATFLHAKSVANTAEYGAMEAAVLSKDNLLGEAERSLRVFRSWTPLILFLAALAGVFAQGAVRTNVIALGAGVIPALYFALHPVPLRILEVWQLKLGAVIATGLLLCRGFQLARAWRRKVGLWGTTKAEVIQLARQLQSGKYDPDDDDLTLRRPGRGKVDEATWDSILDALGSRP